MIKVKLYNKEYKVTKEFIETTIETLESKIAGGSYYCKICKLYSCDNRPEDGKSKCPLHLVFKYSEVCCRTITDHFANAEYLNRLIKGLKTKKIDLDKPLKGVKS